MQFQLTRTGLQVKPDTSQDEAFIEDTLGLKSNGESIRLFRRNLGQAPGSVIDYLETDTSAPPATSVVAEEMAAGLGKRVSELESAIRDVLDQKFDDICWMDVYTKLGKLVGKPFEPHALDPERMLRNCELFVDSVCHPGKSYSRDVLSDMAKENVEAQQLLTAAGFSGQTSLPGNLRSALDVLTIIKRL